MNPNTSIERHIRLAEAEVNIAKQRFNAASVDFAKSPTSTNYAKLVQMMNLYQHAVSNRCAVLEAAQAYAGASK